MPRQHPRFIVLISWLSLPLLAWLALTWGRFNFSWAQVWFGLWHPTAPGPGIILWTLRLPRIVGALLIGAALACAGLAYQKNFANPLVSPDLLGVANGAAVGAAGAILLNAPWCLIQLMAFAGGLLAVTLALLLPRLLHQPGKLALLLAGVVISGFMQAVLGLFKYLADPDSQLQSIVYWQLGSLDKLDFPTLLAGLPSLAIGFGLLFALRWHLTGMATGMTTARSVGINPAQEQGLVVLAATLLTASAVALCGTIGWVGLVIPHLARMLIGDDARFSLPLAACLGAGFMLVVDTLARCLSAGEIPLGILTGFIGTPVFILLLAHQRGFKK